VIEVPYLQNSIVDIKKRSLANSPQHQLDEVIG
jgi:hypothetical protein